MDRRRQMRAKGEGITRIESRITTNLIKQESNDTGEVTREWQLKGRDELANLGSSGKYQATWTVISCQRTGCLPEADPWSRLRPGWKKTRFQRPPPALRLAASVPSGAFFRRCLKKVAAPQGARLLRRESTDATAAIFFLTAHASAILEDNLSIKVTRALEPQLRCWDSFEREKNRSCNRLLYWWKVCRTCVTIHQ